VLKLEQASLNGVVSLRDSTWTVTGTSYLTHLAISAGSRLAAPQGHSLTLTVDGVATPVRSGTYKGGIVLKVAKG
jgi:hypothetical protein